MSTLQYTKSFHSEIMFKISRSEYYNGTIIITIISFNDPTGSTTIEVTSTYLSVKS